jgi:hypothetical protein
MTNTIQDSTYRSLANEICNLYTSNATNTAGTAKCRATLTLHIYKADSYIVKLLYYRPSDQKENAEEFVKWDGQQWNRMYPTNEEQIQFSNTANWEFFKTATIAGGKSSNKCAHKRTDKKVKVGNATRCVYEGPRGGQYVKINNKFVSLKSALKKK